MQATDTMPPARAGTPEIEFIRALASFQSAMEPAKFDSENSHLGNRYASLASIMSAILKPLTANGLTVRQCVTTTADGVTCTTTISHTGGHSWSESISMPIGQRTPQGFGSASTYARRYALCAMLGVVAEQDDDGNAANARGHQQQGNRQQQRPPANQQQPAKTPPADKRIPAEVIIELTNRWATHHNEGVVDGPQFVAWAQGVTKSKDDLAKRSNWTLAMVEAANKQLGGGFDQQA